MRRIALVTIALSCMPIAHAQPLYQCAGLHGNSYQQSPCAASVRLVRTMETSPEPPLSRQQLEARERKAVQDRAESAFLSHMAGTDRMPEQNPRKPRAAGRPSASGADRCARAKVRREDQLADIEMHRTVDLLRRLDAAVAVACGDR